jgi:hypothetical protein
MAYTFWQEDEYFLSYLKLSSLLLDSTLSKEELTENLLDLLTNIKLLKLD